MVTISTLNIIDPNIFVILEKEQQLHDEMELARECCHHRPVIIELVEDYFKKADAWKEYFDQHKQSLLIAKKND